MHECNTISEIQIIRHFLRNKIYLTAAKINGSHISKAQFYRKCDKNVNKLKKRKWLSVPCSIILNLPIHSRHWYVRRQYLEYFSYFILHFLFCTLGVKYFTLLQFSNTLFNLHYLSTQSLLIT